MSIVAVSTKGNYRRAVPKTYSYRYEVAADAGPEDEPLVRAGAVIIDGHYRGRSAVFNVSRSMVEPDTYVARGGYVHPLEENPMAYPPRAFGQEPSAPAPTPGFPASTAAKVMRASATRFGSAAAALAAKIPPSPAQIKRREGVRATPANEPASYRRTG